MATKMINMRFEKAEARDVKRTGKAKGYKKLTPFLKAIIRRHYKEMPRCS